MLKYAFPSLDKHNPYKIQSRSIIQEVLECLSGKYPIFPPSSRQLRFDFFQHRLVLSVAELYDMLNHTNIFLRDCSHLAKCLECYRCIYHSLIS